MDICRSLWYLFYSYKFPKVSEILFNFICQIETIHLTFREFLRLTEESLCTLLFFYLLKNVIYFSLAVEGAVTLRKMF